MGAALAFWYDELNNKTFIDKNDSMNGSYLGPEFPDNEIEKHLKNVGAVYEKKSYEEMIEILANELKDNRAIGWFQGRMEFGPRVLLVKINNC